MSASALHVLNTWSWDPTIIVGTALLATAYLVVLGPFRSRFDSSARPALVQTSRFLLGLGVILFALVSPLDEIGDHYLFSAHMLQHALLMLVAPPLLLSGLSGWMLRPLLLHPVIRPAANILTFAPVALFLFNLNLVFWHLPVFYEATLDNETLHIIEHVSFVVLGMLNWWPLLSPIAELPRLPYLGQILYLILNLAPSAALGWFFVSAPTTLYPAYAQAPQIFAVSARDDQLLGGYMMAMPGGLIYLGTVLLILNKWVKRPGLTIPQL